jgi:EAL domain-containing protein (putative c-di-GMP-specific phosphodiesterase class I)
MQAQTWLAGGIRFGTVAVNISAVEFRNERFLEDVCGILESTGLEPCYLELELTETAVMRDFEATSAVLQSLSAMGIRIAVDDFGTGYSNLSYLKRFPIHTLKIGQIVRARYSREREYRNNCPFRHSHGAKLAVDRGRRRVENAKQLKFLQSLDCAEGQSYYFGRPMDPIACQALISVGELRLAKQLSVSPLRAFK